MIKFVCNKIGRDKGLEGFQSQNITCKYKILKGEELIKALKEKLVEESQEVKDAINQQELIAEIADVMEVVNGLCKASNISFHEIEKIRKQKYIERGGFENGLYVETVEMEENNPRITHFRKNPDKYPEIN